MVSIQPIIPTEIEDISRLIERVFMQFEAPEYSKEGIDNFLAYIKPDEFEKRLRENHFDLVAKSGITIVGIIEVRSYSHICLLFVAPEFQKQGIAKELVHQSLEICKKFNPNLRSITVNSSPYAKPIYYRLGFRQLTEEQTKSGIRYTPMVCFFSRK